MMIEVIAKRRVRFEGAQYAKGDRVPMPLQQFQDLEPTGLFERAPKVESETTAPITKPKGKTAR